MKSLSILKSQRFCYACYFVHFLLPIFSILFTHMAGFKTPTSVRYRSRLTDNAGLETPIKIPASPFLERIGYGTGVAVYMLERSPKVGFIRSPWAIKKWLKGKNNEANNERLQLEADTLRQLNHPNIVGFRAFTTGVDGKYCLAMEALDISLGDKIEQKYELGDDEPYPAKDIMKVSFEIAKGLKYLHHTAHILHGDIKSANILISHDFNVVKLCDFGHSLPLTESLELNTSKGNFSYIGTECWNPPEVIQENGPVTNTADIWTYGLVIWEMIALSPPHTETSEDESLDETVDKTDMMDDTLNDSNHDMDENAFLEGIMPCMNKKYGTRPALPSIDLDKEYSTVLEVFFICTNTDYKLRPSAKVLVKYFEKKLMCANKTQT
ncbi:lymphokine-activated killer T-cell-originated protein kinase isoform X2 [Odontomachus brunneus]|uniref:lymphokine-activated killer T-cell-originated protein kinase isoform X2 n=1 Tax=Odontomachus brunneus TaxID=486640 RepID=UPI0013F1B7D8|nr:lymphokine-activated killer T-cell-originated protein kinase isoform X2 [Odontomachus brunneus]